MQQNKNKKCVVVAGSGESKVNKSLLMWGCAKRVGVGGGGTVLSLFPILFYFLFLTYMIPYFFCKRARIILPQPFFLVLCFHLGLAVYVGQSGVYLHSTTSLP